MLGPLATASEPHSYDLCEQHAVKLTVPRGWEVVRHEGEFGPDQPDEDDLTALAEAVREAGMAEGDGQVAPEPPSNGSQGVGDAGGRRGHLRALPAPPGD